MDVVSLGLIGHQTGLTAENLWSIVNKKIRAGRAKNAD